MGWKKKYFYKWIVKNLILRYKSGMSGKKNLTICIVVLPNQFPKKTDRFFMKKCRAIGVVQFNINNFLYRSKPRIYGHYKNFSWKGSLYCRCEPR